MLHTCLFWAPVRDSDCIVACSNILGLLPLSSLFSIRNQRARPSGSDCFDNPIRFSVTAGFLFRNACYRKRLCIVTEFEGKQTFACRANPNVVILSQTVELHLLEITPAFSV